MLNMAISRGSIAFILFEVEGGVIHLNMCSLILYTQYTRITQFSKQLKLYEPDHFEGANAIEQRWLRCLQSTITHQPIQGHGEVYSR